MSSNFDKGVDNFLNAFIQKVENMKTEQITQINKDQYLDELNHKVKVYNDVKATLDLCRTMVRALDTTSIDEAFNRKMLIQHIELSQTEALLSVMDVEHEIRGLGK